MTTTHTATVTQKSMKVWTVTCSCGVSFPVRQIGNCATVAEYAQNCADRHVAGKLY